jgi:hypothetical protein
MKVGVIIFLLTLGLGFSNNSLSQKSPIYNSNFQLIADTNYQLSKLEFKEWSYLEDSFLYAMATRYDLPDIMTDNHIALRGIFEFKYSVDSSFYSVQFHLYKYSERETTEREISLIDKFVIPSFEEFLVLFEEESFGLIGKIDIDKATFYLPFSFKTKQIDEYIDSNGYFFSNEVHRPLIDYRN